MNAHTLKRFAIGGALAAGICTAAGFGAGLAGADPVIPAPPPVPGYDIPTVSVEVPPAPPVPPIPPIPPIPPVPPVPQVGEVPAPPPIPPIPPIPAIPPIPPVPSVSVG